MRRNCRGSSSPAVARPPRRVGAPALAVAVLLSTPGLLCTPGLVSADPGTDPDSLAALIVDLAKSNQRLEDLSAAIQTEQEGVNKALVEVETARDNAAAAQHDVEVGQQAVTAASAAIAAAQRRFDGFAAATYMNGPSGVYLTAAGPDDIIATAAASRVLTASSQRVMDNLLRARTEQVNRESAARLAKQKADKAVADAQSSQDDAVSALTEAQRKFAEQQQEIDRLGSERDVVRAKLVTAHRWDGAWDPTLPAVPSANIPGDPVAVVNHLLGISATSAQVTANMGRSFLQQLGLIKANAPDPGITNGRIPRVYGQQASEYVIRRGLSQRGVPYSWGGGNAAGPSHGIGSGSGTVGFDCSGLVLYSFAGVGIKLPHYSGSQYNLGRKIPSSQMRRGDVIFYGPGGSQHVTLYLGNGQMLEAPDVGQTVKVSPVRTSGMTPYVVRYIEY
ncbi:C40 family peptidase [Mycobacterium sp.]|uniref:C40 family peptidase n=1 Tax=Mycobacterium sp. TaxID=1785 RepID=UPI0031CF36AB